MEFIVDNLHIGKVRWMMTRGISSCTLNCLKGYRELKTEYLYEGRRMPTLLRTGFFLPPGASCNHQQFSSAKDILLFFISDEDKLIGNLFGLGTFFVSMIKFSYA